MLSMLRKSLSEETKKSEISEGSDSSDNDSSAMDLSQNTDKGKKTKCNCSGEEHGVESQCSKANKRKKLTKMKKLSDGSPSEQSEKAGKLVTDANVTNLKAKTASLPSKTPDWGIKLLEILQLTIQTEVRNVSATVSPIKTKVDNNAKDIIDVKAKLQKIEKRNKALEHDNSELKEKLLDLEYRQQRNNLIFEWVVDADNETDLQCIEKLRYVLKDIPGLDASEFKIDCCHCLDGAFKVDSKRRIICAFNWYYDIQCILKNRKYLARGVYVSEDFSEEWNDRRRVLRPIFNAAKCNEKLKSKTHMSKDKLIIDGKPYTAASVSNISQGNTYIDVTSTCQHSDDSKTIFLGSHSPYSNLYQSNFVINKCKYNCVEQYFQSSKAAALEDDASHFKIMQESNPYRIKRLGAKICNFDQNRWKKIEKDVMYKAVCAKFTQNQTLRSVLADSGETPIAESSTDSFWGTGLHLHDRNALDKRLWKSAGGGEMANFLARV